MRHIKVRRALKIIIAIAVLGALLLGGARAIPSSAATRPLTIKSMHVSVWPEYDNNRILVIYQGEFNNAGDFPSDVTFLTPQDVEIGQVCALQNGTDHLCQLYESRPEKSSLAVNYNLPIPTFYIEYYYNGLNGGPDKNFSFQFESPYDIGTLQLEVQQPLRSSGFQVSPPTGSTSTDARGFKYYNYRFENVTPDKVITVAASYNKPDSKPSVTSSGEPGSGGSSLPLVFGFLGAAALVAATWYLLSRARKPARQTAGPARSRARPAPVKIQPVTTQKSDQPVAFCPYCGRKMGSGYRFCPGCGKDVEKHP